MPNYTGNTAKIFLDMADDNTKNAMKSSDNLSSAIARFDLNEVTKNKQYKNNFHTMYDEKGREWAVVYGNNGKVISKKLTGGMKQNTSKSKSKIGNSDNSLRFRGNMTKEEVLKVRKSKGTKSIDYFDIKL